MFQNLITANKEDIADLWKSYETKKAYNEDAIEVVIPTIEEPEDDNILVISLAVFFTFLGTIVLAVIVYIFLCK